MSNFRLHTPEELQRIAEENFERFKEVSKYYYENDFNFFEVTILDLKSNAIDHHFTKLEVLY